MREIKFRIKSAPYGGWYYFSISEVFPCDLAVGSYDTRTRCQFSGLKDKEHRDIYEDDILPVRDQNLRVVFKNGSFVLVDKNGKIIHMLHGVCHFSKIAGNIHDNPELMQ